MTQNTLSVASLSKHFMHGEKKEIILDNISIQFMQGSTYAIRGVSGTGKSTFMHLLAGFDTPSSGSVLFNSAEIHAMSDKQQEQFLNHSIGVVFQSPHLIRELSVLENIMLPGFIGQQDESAREQRAQELLHEVGIAQKAHEKPSTLSGGQQQRVALARALFNEPSFLIADEPTGNLDIATGRAMVDLITACQKKWKMGVIISTHDDYVAQSMQEVYTLENKKLIQK